MQNKPKSKASTAESSKLLTTNPRKGSDQIKVVKSFLSAQAKNQQKIRQQAGFEDPEYDHAHYITEILTQEELYECLIKLCSPTLKEDLKFFGYAINEYLVKNPDKAGLKEKVASLVSVIHLVNESQRFISEKLYEIGYIKNLFNSLPFPQEF